MKLCIKNEKTKKSPTELEIFNIIDYRSSLEINKKNVPPKYNYSYGLAISLANMSQFYLPTQKYAVHIIQDALSGLRDTSASVV